MRTREASSRSRLGTPAEGVKARAAAEGAAASAVSAGNDGLVARPLDRGDQPRVVDGAFVVETDGGAALAEVTPEKQLAQGMAEAQQSEIPLMTVCRSKIHRR
ncbi:hypothetical protein [Streptomyces sp. A30]|uniref:hypothetical protein n=1 Tax=Streptomyces sp. A30 TaxID=2789273 RepID=UPI00397F4C01